jgi:hypothetical protein
MAAFSKSRPAKARQLIQSASVPLTSSQTDSYGACSQTEYRNVTQGSMSPPASPVTSFTWRSAPTMTA